MVSRVIPVEDFDLVLFGATGDLACRKILPGLFHRFQVGQFSQGCRIVGASRTDVSPDEFRAMVEAALAEFSAPSRDDPDTVQAFLGLLDFVTVDATGETGWGALQDTLRPDVTRVFYLSVAPQLFGPIAGRLRTSGCTTDQSRIVVEKPLVMICHRRRP